MRNAWLILGMLALAGVWLGPLPQLAHGAFFAHMAMHMGVVAVAAPFLALGIAGRSHDPVRRWPALFPPIPISLVELVVVWAWHAPALHHAARHSAAGVVAEQGMFLLAGLLGALLALTPRPLYAHAGHFPNLTPLEDQHLGGAIMLIIGGISYLAGGLWLTAGLVRGAVRKREAVA